ncbi:MAG: hypothetical protein V1729_04555 [Candidatus Woesearchaeota archaeon]
MPLESIAGRTMERSVLNAMLEQGLWFKEEYARILDPHRKSRRWPSSQIGSLVRIASDYYNCWIKFGELDSLIRRDVPLVRDIPRENIRAMVNTICERIGNASYSPEWKNDKSQQHLQKIEESTQITKLMNSTSAEVDERHIIRVFEDMQNAERWESDKRRYVLMDLGTGKFGTSSVMLLNKMDELALRGLIPSDYNEYLEAILVDVNQNATYRVDNKLTNPSAFPDCRFKPVRYVKTINSNFMDLDTNLEIRDYMGRVDSIKAGASLCHITNLIKMFNLLQSLCSDRGLISIWDWHAKTFAAQYLRIPRVSKDGGCFIFDVEPRGGKRRIFKLDDPKDMPQEMHDLLQTSKWTSIYELREEDVKPHHANVYAWLGYWDFMKHDEVNGHVVQREMCGAPVWKHYLEMFNRLVETEQGFSPISDLVIDGLASRVDGIEPFGNSKVRYNFIESYGPEYCTKMEGVGLHAFDVPFQEFTRTITELNGSNKYNDGVIRDLNDTQPELRDAMRLSLGCKNEDYFDSLFSSLGKGR